MEEEKMADNRRIENDSHNNIMCPLYGYKTHHLCLTCMYCKGVSGVKYLEELNYARKTHKIVNIRYFEETICSYKKKEQSINKEEDKKEYIVGKRPVPVVLAEAPVKCEKMLEIRKLHKILEELTDKKTADKVGRVGFDNVDKKDEVIEKLNERIIEKLDEQIEQEKAKKLKDAEQVQTE